jgi:hypothetical protein
MTAHTTIQSSRTAETVVDRKEAVSARISPVSSPDFPSLCAHYGVQSRFLASGLCIQKFRSWQLDFEGAKDRSADWRSGILGSKMAVRAVAIIIADLVRALRTVGSILRGIAQSFNSYAARQTTFDRGFDEVWGEERERDGHIDLSHAAFLAGGDLLDVSGRA